MLPENKKLFALRVIAYKKLNPFKEKGGTAYAA